mmetsp:Transcript_8992/g.21036  ORF Transcript_8992/g.21036 Transcript_8992/m.21036 type:complete len:766 (-) Transcript_8992:88-2385(-)|eukprot:CAMPEP_0182563842 /NCGR_PEP_ID=MMETSP1324-20130603/5906_1 /TAXON_ID=236786 /ORGANISM="Florenciella sp., Strain RCC1587" /LENGTH=765 /DNA_ID=CAMNT_0024777155 /DNA_START=51 /DNA_END=2348 /DNA_ORIENTATION=-
MGAVAQGIFHLLGLVLVLLDLAIYIVTLGPLYTIYKLLTARSTFAAPVGDADINTDLPPSKIWRSVEAIAQGHLTTTFNADCSTAYDALVRSYTKYGDQKAQGIRPLIGWVGGYKGADSDGSLFATEKEARDSLKEKGGSFRFPAKMFGETQERTFAEVGELAHAFGAGLRNLGVQPQPASATEDHKGMLIYDETSAEWMIAAQGAFSQNVVVATAYATLGIDAVIKACKQGGVTVLVCNRKAVPTVLKNIGDMPSLLAIVYTDVLCTPTECEGKIKGVAKGPKVLSWAEVIELGKATPFEPTPPTPESLAVLMYTSGSTGDPKGVMVRHKHLVAFVGGVAIQFGSLLKEGSGEVYLGYLPLAHILEIGAEIFYYSTGNAVCYADPKSLLGGPERSYPHGGLDEFKPTLMAGVPKVWEGIKAGAQKKVEKSGALAKFLIALAIKMKSTAAKNRMYTPLFNVLLKKFKNTVGGKLKACLSGGGAISAEVQEWVRTALDCPLVQGYGLTETCAGATIQMPDDMSIGIAGTPISSMEITLHSEPEITDSAGVPYMATDTVHSDGKPCGGRGEVWLRGPNLTSGYYKMEAKTAEDFDADGWFHTGDIGMLSPGGALRIVDRKKNLVKLKGGEYVALEKMNTTYNNSPFVEVENGGVCSYAHDSMDRAVCLAQCKESELVKAAAELGVTFSDPMELCTNPKIQDAVLTSFKAEAKKGGLTALETVVGVYPLLEPWSPENACLTATQKLVPKKVEAFNAKELAIIKKKGIR